MQRYVQELVTTRDRALRLAVLELELDKGELTRPFLTKIVLALLGYALRFGKVPSLACSGLTNPVYDFSGRLLQNLLDLDKPAFNISFTLLPTDDGGILSFGWSKRGEHVCKSFVTSLLSIPDCRKTDAIVQLIFDCCENHVAEPNWWENLAPDIKADLQERFLNWTDVRPIDTGTLVPSASRFGDWSFEGSIWL